MGFKRDEIIKINLDNNLISSGSEGTLLRTSDTSSSDDVNRPNAHYVMDCREIYDLDILEALVDPDPATNLCVSLIEEIVNQTGQTPLGKMHMHVFPSDEEAGFEAGVTCFLVLQESHISIHTYKELKGFALDLYSCKQFDSKLVQSIIMRTIGMACYSDLCIDRMR